MPFQLERFRITGLHGTGEIDIPIKDNKLILVGENGTGKTTTANFMYYFLARRWDRMAEYQFESVQVNMRSGTKVKSAEISRQDIVHGTITSTHSSRRLPPSLLSTIERIRNEEGEGETLNDISVIQRLSDQYRISESVLYQYLVGSVDETNVEKSIKKRDEIDNLLTQMLQAQVLYLPTFRRIEKALKHISEDYNVNRDRSKTPTYRFGSRKREPFKELVEFGMDDVKNTLRDKRFELLRSNKLNDLAGIYLKDVIDEILRDVSQEQLSQLDDTEVNDALRRVRKSLLSDRHKTKLKKTIAALRQQPQINDIDKATLQVIVRLVQLHSQQLKNETPMKSFVEICNKYLAGKELVFDNSTFDITVWVDSMNRHEEDGLGLDALSSGEKQIVSLFSHLYLSRENGFFVIIDEPEMSLSVPWQREFLPDILGTNQCVGLVAVTHSPFIFDNGLADYAHDIKEFWK
ncbi:MAG: AAA family ATPase [Chloroflexota bacterium]|nr:AAA family ATPase [Chloroflexota bacterium]